MTRAPDEPNYDKGERILQSAYAKVMHEAIRVDNPAAFFGLLQYSVARMIAGSCDPAPLMVDGNLEKTVQHFTDCFAETLRENLHKRVLGEL